jgi:arsenate reductase
MSFLDEKGIKPLVKEYLKEEITAKELKDVVKLLGIKAEELVRKTEADYKENFKGKDLNEEEWIKAMLDYPKLIQRPIIIKGNKAVIGRPTEKILDLM